MHPLDEAYEQILDPVNFVKNFATEEQFIEWVHQGSVLDIEEVIRVFAYHELYEHCSLMRRAILEKKQMNQILNLIGEEDG